MAQEAMPLKSALKTELDAEFHRDQTSPEP